MKNMLDVFIGTLHRTVYVFANTVVDVFFCDREEVLVTVEKSIRRKI